MEYTGIITETLRREVKIEAESSDEAQEKLEAMYRSEEVVLHAEDWFNTDFAVTESAGALVE